MVCRYLRARGYTVEVVAPESVPDTPADLELRVERCAFEEALQRAQEFARTEEDDAMVLVAPGIFQAPEPKPALASPGVQAATVEAATTQTAAPASPRQSPWSHALAAAWRDAAQAFRWAGSEAGDKLGRATSGLGAWRRSLAAGMQPQAAKWRAGFARRRERTGEMSRAALTSARLDAADAAARTRRAGRRSRRRIQEWRAALAVWEAAQKAYWREAREARRLHHQILREQEAAERLRALRTARQEEAERLARRECEAEVAVTPLGGQRTRAASPPLPAPAAAPWGRTFAATTGLALLLLLLWNGFAGRRAAEHLPPDASPAAALPAPFAPAVEPEPAAETAAAGEAAPAPSPASQRMPAAPQAARADTVTHREPEVVIRHFEPPVRREPAGQQPSVKQISDLD
jgi:hypothetical protein